jgi:hypothetical protein
LTGRSERTSWGQREATSPPPSVRRCRRRRAASAAAPSRRDGERSHRRSPRARTRGGPTIGTTSAPSPSGRGRGRHAWWRWNPRRPWRSACLLGMPPSLIEQRQGERPTPAGLHGTRCR